MRDATACDHAMFFERRVLDALYMLAAESALTRDEIVQYVQQFPYNGVVFLLPPWEEIYDTDSERDQSSEESVEVLRACKGGIRNGLRNTRSPT
ncbi:AAA family ATPase [Zobellella sp. DQSA1]|uniref:AAA family ATPase n=1 Tax=Zobellella sp. DQSA1 TaxID=3342386 RepID=UPI0035C09A0A